MSLWRPTSDEWSEIKAYLHASPVERARMDFRDAARGIGGILLITMVIVVPLTVWLMIIAPQAPWWVGSLPLIVMAPFMLLNLPKLIKSAVRYVVETRKWKKILAEEERFSDRMR